MTVPTSKIVTITVETCGERIDRYIADHMDECTRSRAARLIRDGAVSVDGTKPRASHKVAVGEIIEVRVDTPTGTGPQGEHIPLDVLFEDDDIIVINKAVGMVVHPAPGNRTGTLVNALMYHWRDNPPTLGDSERPGIVHRLDKDTSGVMVVARSDRAYSGLVKQIHDRSAVREYLALVEGVIAEDRGQIDAPIGRSTTDRKRMSVTGVRSRDAVTMFEVQDRFVTATLARARLKTGRTHQIRVHMAFAGHPVIGDPKYGARRGRTSDWLIAHGAGLDRQALHAVRLSFRHPASGKMVAFDAPIPDDMAVAIDMLRKHCSDTTEQ